MKKQILDTFNFRHACKSFDVEKKINDEDFNLILETGRLSPSSFGWEPWKFLVIQNPELREKLKEFAWGAQTQLPTASHFVIILSRKSADLKHDSEYLKYISNDIQHLPEEIQDMKLDFFKQFKTNDFSLTDDDKVFAWSTKQSYIPFGNMMTTAAHLGIDSCPIEGFNIEKVNELLSKEGIIDTNHYGVSVMAAFGYRAPNNEMFPKTRRQMDEVVKFIK